MSEQGSKGGKGLGKGGVKRHGKVRQCDCVEGGTTKLAIQKLARCGGVKRLSGLRYDQPCDFVKNCVQDAQAQLEAENIKRFIATYMEYGFLPSTHKDVSGEILLKLSITVFIKTNIFSSLRYLSMLL